LAKFGESYGGLKVEVMEVYREKLKMREVVLFE